ncbi:putative disease resistance protein RGA1, partial [Bienertia sinuspersici]
MGKTTLANKVYTNKRVESHFNERMWISYLEGFNIKTVLNLMVESLRKGNYEDASRQTAIETLRGHLGGRRYLLVLDDVWNTNIDLWNSMRYALEDIGGSKDSMVLITTRDDAVVKAMDPSSVHPLSRLSEPNSWSLFEKIACVEQFNGDAFAFKDIGRRIVAKCKGVPLAIRSIAGVLYHKKNLREWMKIEESELWYVLRNETNNRTGVLAILKLSYDHLPSKLKKCFCLCALWPKGWLVEKYDLIGRWMALGLLETSIDENLTMEDVGERYLSALVSISFVIVNKRNEFGEEYLYSLHDLVYDLARTIVMHERMYLEAGKRVNKVPDIQHLTTIGYAEITSDFPDKLVLKNIRSLDMLKNLPRGILEDVKYLRVLCLAHSSLEVVLESLSRLKCLKYLQLEGNPIKMLPKCIMKLYNLQSLFLYECKSLSRLPIGLNNLVNLRHLGLSFHLCPNKGTIEQLSQLQTLPPLQLIEGGFQISELGCLPDLKGTLDIKGLELVKSKLDAKESKLSTKLRVEQLQLSWDDDGNCEKQEEVLDGLCPHENLKKITLKGYQGDEFPSWLMRMNVFQESRNGFAGTLQNLIKIELLDCKKCKRLPTLGQL